jgi:hypothetical protein
MTEEEERVPPFTGVERLDEAVAGPRVRHAVAPFRMTSAPEDDSADSADETIELALTEEDMLALSRAAEEEHADTSPGKSAPITTTAFLLERVQSRRWLPVLTSSVLAVAVGVALEIVADRNSTLTTKVPSVTTGPAASYESPVRFSNPFDASEVFEFPPGTNDDQARRSVATVLLQRARDRQVAAAVPSNRPMPHAAADPARIARNSGPRGT